MSKSELDIKNWELNLKFFELVSEINSAVANSGMCPNL
jgi:hypothetical protein